MPRLLQIRKAGDCAAGQIVVVCSQEDGAVVDRDGLFLSSGAVWDYKTPYDAHHDEAFLRWYSVRVLT